MQGRRQALSPSLDISQYNANGELLNQDVVNEANSTGDYDMAYTGYDAAGNVTSEQMTQGDIRSNYTYHEVLYEGYKEGSVVGVDTNTASSNQTNGTTTESHDVNGNLIGVTDSANAADDRSFINDVNGTALQKTQDGNVYITHPRWFEDAARASVTRRAEEASGGIGGRFCFSSTL